MRRTTVVSRRSFVSAALSLAGAFHVSAEEPKPETPAYNRITDEQEIELGRECALEIEREQKLQFIEDRDICNYASNLLSAVARASRRPGLPYSVKVINARVVNAFALPGGRTYLYRGLLEWVRSESELVAVLGHEVGHVVGRHGANAIARATAADSLLSEASRILLGDDTPARIVKQLGGPAALLAILKYSRTQEFEADLLGFYNMQRSGYSPRGMTELFAHFGEDETAADSWLTIVSSHPAPSDRASQIRSELAKFPAREGLAYNSGSFSSVQAALKRIPVPKQERA